MFSNWFSSIDEHIYVILDDLVFTDSSIIDNISDIIGTNFNSGITLICNALIYGFLIYYSISYLLSHLTFSQVERPAQFIFKLLLCVIALNYSQYICSAVISLFSNISQFIIELGEEVHGVNISFSTLVNKIDSGNLFSQDAFNLFSFTGFLKGLSCVGFINLTISYAIRYVMIKALVILSPFAMLSLCNSKTSHFFKSWFRIFISILFLQVLVAIILIICYTISYDTQYLFTQLIHIGMVYSLIRANSFVKEFLGGFSTDVNINFSSITSAFNNRG